MYYLFQLCCLQIVFVFLVSFHIFDEFWFTIFLGWVCFKKSHNVFFSTIHYIFYWLRNIANQTTVPILIFANALFFVSSFSSNLFISFIDISIDLKAFSSSMCTLQVFYVGMFVFMNLMS